MRTANGFLHITSCYTGVVQSRVGVGVGWALVVVQVLACVVLVSSVKVLGAVVCAFVVSIRLDIAIEPESTWYNSWIIAVATRSNDGW